MDEHDVRIAAEAVYQAFKTSDRKCCHFSMISQRMQDPDNVLYLETAQGRFLITVKPLEGPTP